jgi:hypothetical protein
MNEVPSVRWLAASDTSLTFRFTREAGALR